MRPIAIYLAQLPLPSSVRPSSARWEELSFPNLVASSQRHWRANPLNGRTEIGNERVMPQLCHRHAG
jgi:hypothetical protein